MKKESHSESQGISQPYTVEPIETENPEMAEEGLRFRIRVHEFTIDEARQYLRERPMDVTDLFIFDAISDMMMRAKNGTLLRKASHHELVLSPYPSASSDAISELAADMSDNMRHREGLDPLDVYARSKVYKKLITGSIDDDTPAEFFDECHIMFEERFGLSGLEGGDIVDVLHAFFDAVEYAYLNS